MHAVDSSLAVEGGSRPIDTSLVRALAVLLVMNSHLEHFYPLPFLADGGLLGLALFFAASGFGVTSSPRIRTQGFFTWMWRRLKRLYPAVTITVLIFAWLINNGWQQWNPVDYFSRFIYPTQYHFIAKITPFYVLLFFLARWSHRHKYRFVFAALLVACLVAAIPDMRQLFETPQPLGTGKLAPVFLWLVFLVPTIIAAWIAERERGSTGMDTAGSATVKPNSFFSPLSFRDGLWLMLCSIGYVGSKIAIAKMGILPWLFPIYFAIAIGLSFQLFRVLSHPQFVAWLQTLPFVWPSIAWLSAISLESYVVHVQMMRWPVWQRFAFPLNLFVFAIASLACAWLVHQLANKLQAVRQ